MFRCRPGFRVWVWVAAAVAASWAFAPPAQGGFPAPLLTVEEIFRTGGVRDVELSPDGRYLSMLSPRNSCWNLRVIDLQEGTQRWVTDMREESLLTQRWAKPNRILFTQQFRGQERIGLYSVAPDGTELTIVSQASRREVGGDWVIGDERSLIHSLPDHPTDVIIGAVRGASVLEDLFRLNLQTGRKTPYLNNHLRAFDFIFDRESRLRMVLNSSGTRRDRSFGILYRPDEKAEFSELARFDLLDPNWRPLRFEPDGRHLVISTAVKRDRVALARYDPESRAVISILAEDPEVDVYHGVFAPDTGHLVGARLQRDLPEHRWLDPAWERLHRDIGQALPGTITRITSFSRDGQLLVILAFSDRDPGTYYLFNRQSREMTEVGRVNPGLRPEDLAPMQPIRFEARDGQILRGYLTLPVGVEPKGLPMVVLVHGGPFGIRDVWGFDPEVQFYANRGFAVLQVNFRGSGGYGQAFERAGYGQWGGKMQDDLTDGVRWAVAQGYADARRVGIAGASYGGFAVLAGLVFTPELYAFGVNLVGVSDLDLLLDGFGRLTAVGQQDMAERIGHPQRDRKRLDATNPIRFIERIRVPTIHGYGANDPRVRISHWSRLEKELKRHGKPYDHVVAVDEGHGFQRLNNLLLWYLKVDAYLQARRVEWDQGKGFAEGEVALLPPGPPAGD